MPRHIQLPACRTLLSHCVSQPLALACLLLALTQASVAGKTVIVSFDPPGSVATNVTGLNRTGTVVGFFQDAQEGFHGFSRSTSGQITVIDVAGPTSRTRIDFINDNGDMIGYYYDTSTGVYQGFLLDQFANLTSFNVEGYPTFPTSINTLGEIAGLYGDSGNLGFVRDTAGNITTFSPPNALSVGTPHLDEDGRIAGNYSDANNVAYGYVRGPSGNFTTFSAPDAVASSGRGTFVTGITVQGTATAGYSTDGMAVGHCFIREAGNSTVFEVPGAGSSTAEGSYLTGINTSGTVVGNYLDPSSVSHGFVRDSSGNIAIFDDKNAGHGYGQGTFPMVINRSGQVAGIYTNSSNGAGHAFLRVTK